MKFLSFATLLLVSSCTMQPASQKHEVKVYRKKKHVQVKYDFEHPDNTFSLNSSLTEISGLSYDSDKEELISVNDEKGKIYALNPNDGTIHFDMTFHSDGDYEGIEKVGDDVFVLKSNGTIYQVSKSGATEIDSPLSVKNDVEGLGYDAGTQQLLLACKANPLNTGYKKGTKAVYSYFLSGLQWRKGPYLLIKRNDVQDFLKKKNAGEKTNDRSKLFSPSGIAVHPLTNNIYILSARGSMMLVYNKEHKPVQCVFFDRGKNPQPEGICFSPDGTLYISTEGQGHKAKVFKFSPQN